MVTMKRRMVALLIAFSMAATLGLVGCGGGGTGGSDSNEPRAQMISGLFTGQVGVKYGTEWFEFTINTMTTGSEFAGHTAAEGFELVIANVTITNTSGATQPFGTFDWFIDDDLLMDYLFPLSPLTDSMMPDFFELANKETATYDLVIEIPINLPSPYLIYVELSEYEDEGATVRIPVN